jgi:hypothetical protein
LSERKEYNQYIKRLNGKRQIGSRTTRDEVVGNRDWPQKRKESAVIRAALAELCRLETAEGSGGGPEDDLHRHD